MNTALGAADQFRAPGAAQIPAGLLPLAMWGTGGEKRRAAMVRIGLSLEGTELSCLAGSVLATGL